MDEIIKSPDISTPYSYARLTTRYSLLQQQILLKVSRHLQDYVKTFFGSERSKTREKPKSLFTLGEKAQGVGQIRVSYAELGVSANNFGKAREAAMEVLNIKIPGKMRFDENGKPLGQEIFNLFSDVKVEKKDGAEASAATFNLNMQAVDFAIDMSEGYVTHPEDIALIASTEKLPPLYYLLKHEMKNWTRQSVRLTLFDIKDFIGMVERDENGQIVNIAYKKFSQFKQRIIEPTLKNIQQLRDDGLLDMSFEVKYIYAGKRQVGDPAYVQFTQVVVVKEQPKEQQKAEEVKPDFAERYQQDRNTQIWQSILLHTNGGIKEHLQKMSVHGVDSVKKMITLNITESYIKVFEDYANAHMDEYKAWLALCSKHFGKEIKSINYYVPKK